MNRFWLFLLALVVLAAWPLSQEKTGVRVGSKKFTENVIVGELIADAIRSQGVTAIHYRELGGTRLVFNALVKGDIDTYPEYTGTLTEETFADRAIKTDAELQAALAEQGVVMTKPLGFNNKYAIGMLKSRARQLGIQRYRTWLATRT